MTDPVPAVTDELPVEAVETPVAPAPVVNDRADNPVTEVAERFLRAVVASVPLDQIEELHLFSPLRQGTVETGIAVLAARVPVVIVEPAAEAPVVSDEPELAFDHDVAEDIIGDEASDNDDVTIVEDVGADLSDSAVAEPADISADEANEGNAIIDAPTPKERPVRHTVYTARYRYVIKGPERGKWESNVKAEAEAPLITVETVVRGVQRRAGEDSEIVRYSAAQIARALRLPYPG